MTRVQIDPLENAADLGVTLRLLRTERGENLTKVAEAVGVSHAALSYWERGENTLSFDSAIKLLRHYGLRIRVEEAPDD